MVNRRRILLSSLVAFSLLASTGTACRSDGIFSLMSDSTFVQAMRDLRRLPVGSTGDATVRTIRRDSILAVHGITGPELESTAVWLARDPARATAIWRAIEAELFSPP